MNTSPTQTSVRTFEIMGTGGFYLTCYTSSHENLFKNHEHLVWSASPEQTVELIDYYLKHDDERTAIASKGQAEIFGKHTYYHRGHQFEKEMTPYLRHTNPRV